MGEEPNDKPSTGHEEHGSYNVPVRSTLVGGQQPRRNDQATAASKLRQSALNSRCRSPRVRGRCGHLQPVDKRGVRDL